MDKYLTPKLKSYYMKDLEEKVIPNNDHLWKLDEGVLDHLIVINENPLIQTLYSRKHGPSSGMLGPCKSYLYFAYAEELEDLLFKDFIPKITCIFCSEEEESICYYSFDYPQSKEDDNDVIVDLGCTKNGSYFDVNNIKISFIHYLPERHDRFWEFLSKNLGSMGR